MAVPPDLQIFFPNGGTSGAQMYIWDGSKPVAWDGTVTGGGGGTQYIDGSTHATPTGNAILWLDTSDVVRVPSATKPLPVNIITATTVTVTGPLTDTQLRASAVPVSAVITTGSAQIGHLEANQSVNVAQINGVTPLMGAGNTGTGSQRVTIASDQAVIPIIASLETGTIYNGATALTPKFAKIAASSSGNNNIVAAVTSKKIRVLAYNFISNGTVNAKFQSDGAGTPADLTGPKYCVANVGISASFCPVGYFESASGKSLDINLSAGVAIGGELVYVEV